MKIRAKIPKVQVEEPCTLKAGEFAEDGSIYLGCHDEHDWYVAAEDLTEEGRRLFVIFSSAASRTAKAKLHGHNDWVLPPSGPGVRADILSEMHKRRDVGAFKGTFAQAPLESQPPDYWSSEEEKGNQFNVRCISFATGRVAYKYKQFGGHIRPVRAVSKKVKP